MSIKNKLEALEAEDRALEAASAASQRAYEISERELKQKQEQMDRTRFAKERARIDQVINETGLMGLLQEAVELKHGEIIRSEQKSVLEHADHVMVHFQVRWNIAYGAEYDDRSFVEWLTKQPKKLHETQSILSYDFFTVAIKAETGQYIDGIPNYDIQFGYAISAYSNFEYCRDRFNPQHPGESDPLESLIIKYLRNPDHYPPPPGPVYDTNPDHGH